MIKGKKVYLSAIEKEDLQQLMNWRNRSDFRKYFREYKEINSIMQEKWFQNKVLNDNSTIMFAIKKVENDELIGCCGLCYINWVHGNADLSLYIGWNNEYIDDKGYSEESCKLLFNYGFFELRLNKIWTEIYEFDYKKKKLYEKLGFSIDGVLRESYFYEGRFLNSYILSLLSREFKQYLD
ncbi:GNAT family N-acetyltransferase [Clostridium tetani]|uniref:GNAT family N-acetyltransferase n=1 Tax=Clostridium tetani TaxID=1513 RepID=UPI000512E361|nr:GNAT family protein [Clostridium tetani]KGI39722.1 acetyltransferase [Clostridium tetani ATCC 9441]SUY66796.1 GNAT family acetyltransferase [Clostridium tetani]